MEFIVNKDWHTFQTSMYLKYERDGRRVIVGQKDGMLVETALGENIIHKVDPLLTMPEGVANDFIKAVVEYANGEGIKTENENLLQGKLAATEKHLEDMRVSFSKLLDKMISI